jgi:hydroxymethylpyrimidine pyrophosphatase-like HAD family hydrolase
VDPNKVDPTWGETIYTDFIDYSEKALKFCVEIFDDSLADRLAACLPNCDCLRFSGSAWYKFTKKEATKENAIRKVCKYCGIDLKDVIAFGDDTPDIGMLKLCGTGVAMVNAINCVKEVADVVIGSNDEDGIANYLEEFVI